MNKKFNSLLISFLTLMFLIEFLINNTRLINTFFQSIYLWFNYLLPTIFIFFTLTDILNNYNFPYYLEKVFGKIIYKVYRLPTCTIYTIIMSMTSGFPGNSKLIKEQLDNNLIDSYTATRLLTMTHFSNPLFILYTIGNSFLHNKKIGMIILLVHFITNFFIGFIFRNIFNVDIPNKKSVFKTPLSFMSILKNSINTTINISLNVLGIIIFFSFITTTINHYLNLNIYSHTFLNGILEITNGLKLLSNLNINIITKSTLATFFISFGGLSIHMQIMSILNKYHINYLIYLLSRIIHGTISALIVYIILINS